VIASRGGLTVRVAVEAVFHSHRPMGRPRLRPALIAVTSGIAEHSPAAVIAAAVVAAMVAEDITARHQPEIK
jgi:hypothetical protein